MVGICLYLYSETFLCPCFMVFNHGVLFALDCKVLWAKSFLLLKLKYLLKIALLTHQS